MSSATRPAPVLLHGASMRRRVHRARTGTSRRMRAVAAAAALLVGAATLGGCASVRNELGTAQSTCYIALPEALAAVHHLGHLYGVRLVNVASLERRAPLLYRAARATGVRKVSQVCLVAFKGTFAAGHVEKPLGRSTAHLVVVELGYPSKRLFATLLVLRPPLPFGHSHI